MSASGQTCGVLGFRVWVLEVSEIVVPDHEGSLEVVENFLPLGLAFPPELVIISVARILAILLIILALIKSKG